MKKVGNLLKKVWRGLKMPLRLVGANLMLLIGVLYFAWTVNHLFFYFFVTFLVTASSATVVMQTAILHADPISWSSIKLACKRSLVVALFLAATVVLFAPIVNELSVHLYTRNELLTTVALVFLVTIVRHWSAYLRYGANLDNLERAVTPAPAFAFVALIPITFFTVFTQGFSLLSPENTFWNYFSWASFLIIMFFYEWVLQKKENRPMRRAS